MHIEDHILFTYGNRPPDLIVLYESDGDLYLTVIIFVHMENRRNEKMFSNPCLFVVDNVQNSEFFWYYNVEI